jgi:hypothetical protein
LAEQDEAELRKMLDANRRDVARAQDELSRLKVEGKQIEQALARKGRGSRAGRTTVTNDQVFHAAKRVEPPMTPAEVQAWLASNGVEASVNAVRNHMNRLVDRGMLERDNSSRYVVASAPDAGEFISADDDIPF